VHGQLLPTHSLPTSGRDFFALSFADTRHEYFLRIARLFVYSCSLLVVDRGAFFRSSSLFLLIDLLPTLSLIKNHKSIMTLRTHFLHSFINPKRKSRQTLLHLPHTFHRIHLINCIPKLALLATFRISVALVTQFLETGVRALYWVESGLSLESHAVGFSLADGEHFVVEGLLCCGVCCIICLWVSVSVILCKSWGIG
jgi:hypothetical protein